MPFWQENKVNVTATFPPTQKQVPDHEGLTARDLLINNRNFYLFVNTQVEPE